MIAFPPFRSSRLILGAFASIYAAAAAAATVDVAPAEGVADAAPMIQRAIDGSAEGDVVHFAAGTYSIAKAIVLKPRRSYVGTEAILKQVTPKTFAASTEGDRGEDILVRGLGFENGGLDFAGSGKVPAKNIQVLQCSFLNITEKNYPFNVALYDPIGASHCRIVGNFFKNVSGDTGIAAWNTDHLEVTDNHFDGVNECMHLNGTTVHARVLRNTGVRLHRMGIEIQGSGNEDLIVEDNYFAEWVAPYNDSFGLSIVPSSGPNVSVRYNTVLGRPPVPGTWTNRFGFGYELGSDVTCRDNFSEGWWWLGIVIGGKRVLVENNVLRGPKGGEYTTPTKITLEPGSEKETDKIGENTQIVSDAYVEGPDALEANLSNGRVKLTWRDRSAGKAGFAVQRRAAGGDYREVARLTPKSEAYEDDTFDGKSDTIYRLQAFDSAGDFTYSPAVIMRAPTTPN